MKLKSVEKFIEQYAARPALVPVLVLTLMAPSAHAGSFALLSGLFEAKSPALRPEHVLLVRNSILEVPVRTDCAPTFIPGSDGIFRQNEYCHKANPTEPRGFLKMGYDVPASFLTSFTVADVIARWKDQRIQSPQFLDSKVELPVELFTNLNVKAAQAWHMMLTCAQGDAERAREMYRVGVFGCSEESAIRQHLNDLRSSLPTLAATAEVASFMDMERVEQKYLEIQKRQRDIYRTYSRDDAERYRLAMESLTKQEQDLRTLRNRFANAGSDLVGLLEGYLPKMPRVHPLLTQLLYEEILSAVSPDQSSRSVVNKLSEDRTLQLYLTQLLIWTTSIVDYECSAFGLWPTANRVAMESFADKTREVFHNLGAPKSKIARFFKVVTCPLLGTPNPDSASVADLLDIPRREAEGLMLLNDIYAQGHLNVWREVREVRDHYITSGKH